MRDSEIEVREDKLDGRENEDIKGDREDIGIGKAGCSGPSESARSTDVDLGDFHAAGFHEAEADVIPVVFEAISYIVIISDEIAYSELNSLLNSGHESEDVV